MSKLTNLIERVERLTRPDREVDWALHDVDMGQWLRQHGYVREGSGYVTSTPPFEGTERLSGPEYFTDSLDAAVGLADRLLPDADLQIDRRDRRWGAQVSPADFAYTYGADGPEPAIALVLATLRALQGKADEQG